MSMEIKASQAETPLTFSLLLKRHPKFNILFLTLLFFTIEIVDLFGISTFNLHHSRTPIYQAFATTIEKPDWRDNIIVLMLDEQDLSEFGQQWPTEYGFHATILETLKDFEAAAIFVDIAFLDERNDPSISELINVATAYRDKGTPLLMAGTPGEAPYPIGIRHDLADVIGSDVVPVPGGKEDHQSVVYPLWDDNGKRATAAMAIYERLAKLATAPFPDKLDNTFKAKPGQPPMEVAWKINDNRNSLDIYKNKDCHIKSPELWERLLRVFASSLPGVDGDLRNPCPYHTTLTLRQLLSGTPEIEALIKDKIVIYGADVLMAEDMVTPPTNTPLPSVYLHAMALTNLLERGAHYRKTKSNKTTFSIYESLMLIGLPLLMLSAQVLSSPRIRDKRYKRTRLKLVLAGWGLTGITTFVIVFSINNFLTLLSLLLLMALTQWFDDQNKDGRLKLASHSLFLMLWLLITVLIVSAVSYVAYMYMDLGVSNWAGLLLFALARVSPKIIVFLDELFGKCWPPLSRLLKYLKRHLQLQINKGENNV